MQFLVLAPAVGLVPLLPVAVPGKDPGGKSGPVPRPGSQPVTAASPELRPEVKSLDLGKLGLAFRPGAEPAGSVPVSSSSGSA